MPLSVLPKKSSTQKHIMTRLAHVHFPILPVTLVRVYKESTVLP